MSFCLVSLRGSPEERIRFDIATRGWALLWSTACQLADIDDEIASKGCLNYEVIPEDVALKVADALEPFVTDEARWEEWERGFRDGVSEAFKRDLRERMAGFVEFARESGGFWTG